MCSYELTSDPTRRNLKWKNEHIPNDVTTELIPELQKVNTTWPWFETQRLLQKYKRKVTGWRFFFKKKNHFHTREIHRL